MARTKQSSAPSKNRSISSAGASGGVSLKKVKGENFYRNAKDAKRLKMLSGGKPVRDKDGKIIQAAEFQKGEDETKPGRVAPDRRWFGNTRVISQTALDHFRTSLSARKHDPYSVLLRRNKLPMALLDDAANPNTRKRSHIVETEPFGETFGPKAQRKRPRMDVGTFEELRKLGDAAAEDASRAEEDGPGPGSTTVEPGFEPTHADRIEPIYAKGTSRRIYGELYKVIDSSDVVLHVIDARDPLGTMCTSVLEYMRKEKAHKQVVLVLNKCDLVPAWVTARYIQHLTPQYPTIAFHASPNHAFGKGALIQLLRQLQQLHADKKQISVGFLGYPNVGKSSVINTLKAGKVCRVAPVPGETKVWQYITLTKKIYLIDCPGIVPSSAKSDSTTATVLKGVVRVEALASPSEHVQALLERVRPVYLARTYGLTVPESGKWEAEKFLDQLARFKGRLLRGGEPDIEGAAKIVLSDWTRGRIPFFVSPPERPTELNEKEAREKKRKAIVERATGQPAEEEEWTGVTEDAEGKKARLLGVRQNLGSIMQKNTFIPDDVRPLELEATSSVGEDVSEDGAEVEGAEVDDDEDGEEDELTWGDVFAGDKPSSGDMVRPSSDSESSMDAGSEDDDEASDVDAEGDADEDEPLSSKSADKGERMKTNKKKATNFYASANVKNKNRTKAAHMRSLPVGKRHR